MPRLGRDFKDQRRNEEQIKAIAWNIHEQHGEALALVETLKQYISGEDYKRAHSLTSKVQTLLFGIIQAEARADRLSATL